MSSTLNPSLFDNESVMLPEVRDKLLEISEEFINSLEIPNDKSFPLLDIILVGSNASYNYTMGSDIDLHLVTDYSELLRVCPDAIRLIFDLERRIFNKDYDISVNNIPVEVYVEDIRSSTYSNGIYSVYYDTWIKFPCHLDDKLLELPDDDKDYNQLVSDISQVITDENITSDEVSQFIDKLYIMRKNSLSKDGEFGKGNLLFKKLRSKQYLDALKDKLRSLRNKELSL